MTRTVTGAVALHQPAYLPWPGYFSRLLDADELVLLDHVQFARHGWQNRNHVRGGAGSGPVRLTVPIRRDFGQSIDTVRIADGSWARRHWRTLSQAYSRAPFWPRYGPALEDIYRTPWKRLAPLNEALLRLLLDGFALRLPVIRSSELAPAGHRTRMLVDVCLRRGATRMVLGDGAHAYLDHDLPAEHGITVEFASYAPHPYGTAPGWTPHLSALDLLLHEGPNAPVVLRAGARTRTKATS
ncbi:WbqC family protein (plasmid) [Embleya sp. NBC_00888]|uniref:WbqC family protein n=1 Tax=Embleya sp. NBC_00888 TaxID=2975960 RepID=UPI002F90D360|nr:WbqC family protein [Embleya sp. NBC_00888]